MVILLELLPNKDIQVKVCDATTDCAKTKNKKKR